MTSRRYVRRVSPVERYGIVLNEVYHYRVDGVVEGVGHVDPDILQAAVGRAAEANPAIRVRFRGMLGFSRWVDSGIAPRVRVLEPSGWNGTSDIGAQFLLEKLDPLHGGPVADVLVVPCIDGKTRLVFRTLHAAIDGRGLMHWMAEVFRALRGEPLLGSHSRLIDLDVQKDYAGRVPAEPPAPPATCIPVVPPSANGQDRIHYIWRRVVIDRNVSQLLPKTAVFLAAWARRHAAGEVGFTIPIDYRGLRTQEMGLGNLTGYVRLSVPEGATPRAVIQQLNSKVRAFADCRERPGIRKLFWKPIPVMVRALRPAVPKLLYTLNPALPTGGIVSMGNLTLEAGSYPGFAATMIFGIPGTVGKLNVVFLNFRGFASVVFSAPAPFNADGQIDELAQAYRAHFSAAAAAALEPAT
jgi:hypothetical protein